VYSRCLYDATTVAEDVRDVVERTHRRLVTADGSTASPRYQDVHRFEGLPPGADPLEATTPRFRLVDASLKRTRRRVAGAARGRVDAATLDELMFAVSEAVINAQMFGQPPVVVQLWTSADRVVVHVQDAGPGPGDPVTGLVPAPGSAVGAGLGLWLAHQLLTIDIALIGDADGFTVRLRGGRPPGRQDRADGTTARRRRGSPAAAAPAAGSTTSQRWPSLRGSS
jgi:anti-sigma regulatory factor (Ser/Thr protein kinase)